MVALHNWECKACGHPYHRHERGVGCNHRDYTVAGDVACDCAMFEPSKEDREAALRRSAADWKVQRCPSCGVHYPIAATAHLDTPRRAILYPGEIARLYAGIETVGPVGYGYKLDGRPGVFYVIDASEFAHLRENPVRGRNLYVDSETVCGCVVRYRIGAGNLPIADHAWRTCPAHDNSYAGSDSLVGCCYVCDTPLTPTAKRHASAWRKWIDSFAQLELISELGAAA